ncbi:MAG: GroEL [Podoviridae sp. ctrTa16]|nr:MAG: GroEL [Podoviridae sp. ctrTa16]
MEIGYSPKDLCFENPGRARLVEGIRKISAAVKSTLGSSGQTVLIESPNHTSGITVTKDGVTVAKAIELLDPVENLAVRVMKEAAEKTATEAGDGTTTAIVLTEDLILHGMSEVEKNPSMNKTQMLRELSGYTAKVVDYLKEKAVKVETEGDMLLKVATTSANNDGWIGKMISEVYKDVGRDGVVAVEKSKTVETYAETVLGIKVKRGYMSTLFVNDQKRDECVFEDVHVLVSDVEISNILQIEQVLKPIIQGGKKLLIVAPCHTNVINTLAANVMKGNLKVCVIQPPNFGYKQHELMDDLALSVGATYFSEKTGDDLSHITFNDLGHAVKCIVGRDSTVIMKSDVKADLERIKQRADELRVAHEEAQKKTDKDFILERIASLTGGIGVVYVGGNTDLEQKELYDRVDDAVCAVRSALEEGILPGGGKALFAITEKDLMAGEKMTIEKEIALKILLGAIKSPLNQILVNAGLSFEEVYEHISDPIIPFNFGYDVKNNRYGNMLEFGVIDPAKVTRCALQNAVSVATTILSTNAIITMARSYDTK